MMPRERHAAPGLRRQHHHLHLRQAQPPPDRDVPPAGITNTYTYDKAGHIASLTDGGGTATYAYDDLGRVASLGSPNAAGTGTDTVTYTYDDTVTPRKRTATFPGGAKQVTYTDKSGKPTKVEVLDNAGNALNRITYDYTATTAPTNRSLIQSVTTLPGDKTSYVYKDSVEDLRRLLKATTLTSGGTFIEEHRYGYDKSGNRLTKQLEKPMGTTVTTTHAYNAANQLCWRYTGASTYGCGSPPAGATTYAYDAAGNQTTGAGAAYDGFGRMSSTPSCTLAYLTPTQDELVACGTTSYQNNSLGLGRIVAPTSTTDIVREPAGAAVSVRESGAKRYVLTDGLGSTAGLLDTAGSASIARTYTYDPDGNATTAGTGISAPVTFAGGHLVNGLHHFGARWYDPATARWTQPDPVNHALALDLKNLNPYGYAGGDPVN